MKKLLILLLFPLMMFAQDSTITGDVDCDGEVTSQDASLILQFVTSVIDELPCEENMNGLTPDQLEEIINLMSEQLNVNYTGGGGNNYPVMISNISPETMHWGDALIYCDGLEENGYDDWFLPSVEQLVYAVGGGCELPDERTESILWTGTKSQSTTTNGIIVLKESSDWGMFQFTGADEFNCRCVRFGEGETSEGSSGSSNSSGSSGSSVLGNSEQPITMIGPMYLAEDFPEFNHINSSVNSTSYDYGGWTLKYHHAIRFCGALNYNGYDDWYLPSLNQILHFLENNNSNNLGIPNLSNLDYDSNNLRFWTLNDSGTSGAGASTNYKATIMVYGNGVTVTNWDDSIIDVTNQFREVSNLSVTDNAFCFCVR